MYEIENFRKNGMEKHFLNKKKRLETVIVEEGAHFEHLLN